MKTLVIGANGNLGQEVVRQLSGRSEILAGVRNREAAASFAVKTVLFDYDKPETFSEATTGVNRVFMQAPPLDPTAFERMEPFIDYLKEQGISRVVFNSALGVDHNEAAPLRKIERKLMAEGFDYTITRPNFFIENFTTGFASAPLQHNQVIVANAGDGKLSFVSIQDLAGIITDALCHDHHIGKEYNVTGQEALNHQEVADLFSKKMGKEVNYISLTPAEMKTGAMENGVPESSADYLVKLYDIAAAGHMAHISGDVQEVLGRQAQKFDDVLS